MIISLVIINYRSAALTAAAVASARAAAAGELEVVVVDNSCDAAEAEALRSTAIDRLIVSTTNRGYAGGLNDGIRATRGEMLILANPDVVFFPASIDQLVTAAGNGAIAGPRLVWDAAGTLTLPPAELPTAWRKRLAIASSRLGLIRRQRDRAAIRRRYRFFSLTSATRVACLSGAVMALSRSIYSRLGEFDERYSLYFEESDYFMRARRSHIDALYIPSAVCRHLYNQSAGASGNAERLYLESELKYYAKWYGRRVLSDMSVARPVDVAQFDEGGSTMNVVPPSSMVELSPLPTFEAAAGWVGAGQIFTVPPEVLASLRSETLYARVVDGQRGSVHARIRIQAGATIRS